MMPAMGLGPCPNLPISGYGLVHCRRATGYGGLQFFADYQFLEEDGIYIRKEPKDADVESVRDYEKSSIQLEVDGQEMPVYFLGDAPSEILNKAPDLENKLTAAMRELGGTRRKAKRALFRRVRNELDTAKELKAEVFEVHQDDEEIIYILVMAGVI